MADLRCNRQAQNLTRPAHQPFMRKRRLLVLDAHHLTAYRWQSHELVAEGCFDGDGADLGGFGKYLAQVPHSVFYVLVEVADEGFQIDAIPSVRGHDRSAIIARKLGQHFHSTPFRIALSLGREKTGRRDEKLLLTALIRPQQIEPWLATLREQRREVHGIYTLPLLIHTLMRKRLQGAAFTVPRVVITLSSGGLRQTFFDEGQLRFSRLTPLPDFDLSQAPAVCALEAARLRQYLIRQRLITGEVPLATLVLVHPSDEEDYRQHCHDDDKLHFEFADLCSEARRVSLRTLPQDSRSELLFMQLMVQTPPLLQFASASLRRNYHLGKIRLFLNGASALFLLTCLLLSGLALFNYRHLREEVTEARSLTERDSSRYAAILNTLPPLPISIHHLRQVIARYDAIERHAATPLALYERTSRALASVPEIQVTRIDWRSDVHSEQGTVPLGPSVIADVYGQLPAIKDHDQRALLAVLETFSAELGRDEALEVHLQKPAVDGDSGKSLKNTVDRQQIAEAPHFTLRITQRASPQKPSGQTP
jgi:hypothetical protein